MDLNKIGPQFYQAGLQLVTLPHPDAEKLAELLPEVLNNNVHVSQTVELFHVDFNHNLNCQICTQVLQRRAIAMADSYSLNRDVKSTDEMTNNLGNMLRCSYMDPLEVKLFNDSKKASEELDSWLRQ